MDDKQNLYIGKEVNPVSGELKDKFFIEQRIFRHMP